MRYQLLGLFLLAAFSIRAQSSFESINQTVSPAVTALGGEVISTTSYIPSLYLENPALLSDSLNNQISLGFMYHPAGVNHGFFGLVTEIPGIGDLGISFRRAGYGKIAGYDETGVYTGDFESFENVIGLTKAFYSGNFSFGGTLKWMSSQLAGYSANAMMIDFGGAFVHPEKELTLGLVMKNIGGLLNDYTESSESKLPLDVKAGVTFKPEFMPFRFTMTLHNLAGPQSYVFEDPETSNLKKVTSYLVLGTELIWSENIQIMGGYNFMKRYELRLENGVYGAGWSAGLRFRKKDFILEYGFSRQHVAGTINHVALTIDTNKIFGLKRKTNE